MKTLSIGETPIQKVFFSPTIKPDSLGIQTTILPQQVRVTVEKRLQKPENNRADEEGGWRAVVEGELSRTSVNCLSRTDLRNPGSRVVVVSYYYLTSYLCVDSVLGCMLTTRSSIPGLPAPVYCVFSPVERIWSIRAIGQRAYRCGSFLNGGYISCAMKTKE